VNRIARITIATTALLFIAAGWITISLTRENNRLKEKAKVYDEICLAIKSAVGSDIFFLGRSEDEPMRQFVLDGYDNRQIGNRTRMFDWCSHDTVDLHALAACRNRRDYPCIVNILKAVEAKIP
jgi:hypothetical protein